MRNQDEPNSCTYGDQKNHQVFTTEECSQDVQGIFPYFFFVIFWHAKSRCTEYTCGDQKTQQVPQTEECSQDVIDEHR